MNAGERDSVGKEGGEKKESEGKEAALTHWHTNRHTGRASTVLRLGWLR